jgi:hypothetical protein
MVITRLSIIVYFLICKSIYPAICATPDDSLTRMGEAETHPWRRSVYRYIDDYQPLSYEYRIISSYVYTAPKVISSHHSTRHHDSFDDDDYGISREAPEVQPAK